MSPNAKTMSSNIGMGTRGGRVVYTRLIIPMLVIVIIARLGHPGRIRRAFVIEMAGNAGSGVDIPRCLHVSLVLRAGFDYNIPVDLPHGNDGGLPLMIVGNRKGSSERVATSLESDDDCRAEF